MPGRRFAMLALVALAPAACVTQAEHAQQRALREATLARIPANAPAGLLAEGSWLGSIRGSRAVVGNAANWSWGGPSSSATRLADMEPLARDVVLEVHPWRDSARVALRFGSSPARGSAPMPLRDVRVAGDTMTFGLANVLGWRDVSCRLVVRSSGAWEGPCATPKGERAARISLAVPRYAGR